MTGSSPPNARTTEAIREEILRLAGLYSEAVHGEFGPAERRDSTFTPGMTPIPYAGRVFDGAEVKAAVSSVLDFWLTLGPYGLRLEQRLAEHFGARRSLLVNSGSSANLLALATLTSHLVPPERRLGRGDEVITAAAGFPTTAAPIIQCGATVVFVDSDPITLNPTADAIEQAYVEGKTKAVILAHTLGNPFDLERVGRFCRQTGIWLIEDNCDALGSTYTCHGQPPRATGSFGDLSTQSFYPPHHLTMGEGGAVNIAADPDLARAAESLRDWGRDCRCPSGRDDTCRKRYDQQHGDLPTAYDHKYVYSHLGYNLKPLDIQAAIGLVQFDRLESFSAARRRNWQALRRGLAPLGEFLEFMLPQHARRWCDEGFEWEPKGGRSDPSWFGFMIRVRPGAPFTRTDLAQELDRARIGNRMLFGGNLVRQPAFLHLRRSCPGAFRVAGSLDGADAIMNEVLFTGVYPGLTSAMIDYIVEIVTRFCARRRDGARRSLPERAP